MKYLIIDRITIAGLRLHTEVKFYYNTPELYEQVNNIHQENNANVISSSDNCNIYWVAPDQKLVVRSGDTKAGDALYISNDLLIQIPNLYK